MAAAAGAKKQQRAPPMAAGMQQRPPLAAAASMASGLQHRPSPAAAMPPGMTAGMPRRPPAIMQQHPLRAAAVAAGSQQRPPPAATMSTAGMQQPPPDVAAMTAEMQQLRPATAITTGAKMQQRVPASTAMSATTQHRPPAATSTNAGVQHGAPGAATAASATQQQQQFRALHGELMTEARGTAQELGIDVKTIVFRHGCGGTRPRAAMQDCLGVPPAARARQKIRSLLARKASEMGPAELAKHAARLQALRAVVVRKLRGKEMEKKNVPANPGSEGSMVNVKRQHEEQQEMIAGCSKIRREQY